MNWILGGLFTLSGGALWAHPHTQVDQQVALTLAQDRVMVEAIIVPSIEAGADVWAMIDQNGDGQISATEVNQFAQGVIDATELLIDGAPVSLNLTAATVSEMAQTVAGLGQIVIRASTDTGQFTAQPSNVSFAINYETIAHDWYVQPYLERHWQVTLQDLQIDRATHNKVTLGFNYPS
ncbi:DUF1007 family protein [Loktanella sp. S4079]|uniref:DUF1007 family protein n=1 Tax=Loktanella sp. S4079 TaxID=579483 RepID=UPI00138DE492|nr:DUF1007 family protein [Loktanella sp. S4079]